MSSLEGYKPEDSLLTGGEGVTINPSQAGGAGTEPLTDDEKDLIKSAAVIAYLEASEQKEFIVDDSTLNAIAITAAEITANDIIQKRTDENMDEAFEKLEPDEEEAVTKAINDLTAGGKLPANEKEQKDLIRKTAILAIVKVRNSKRIQIERIKEEIKSKMTTPLQNEIKEISQSKIYTEFYHITNPEKNEFSNVYSAKLSGVNSPQFKLYMVTDVEKYKQQRLKQWQSVYKITNKKVNPIIPTIKESDLNRDQVMREYSRFVYCLPYDLQRVIIIPPIRGDPILFTNALFRLKQIGAISYKKLNGKDFYKIKRDTIIVFMPSFYSAVDADPRINNTLFSIFIDINHTNPNQIFILSESTPNYYAVGITFSQSYSKLDILKNSPLTMLEPSYIIYPYERLGNPDGFILSASTDQEKVNIPGDLYSMADLKINKDYGKSLGLAVKPVISNGEIVDGSPKTHTIRSGVVSNPKLSLVKSIKYTAKSCAGLLDSPEINKIFKNKKFSFNDKITLNGEEIYALFVLQLNPIGNYIPICNTVVPEGPDPFSENDRHKSADKYNNTADKTQILIKGNIYSIRNYNEDVNDDWKKRIFTNDEADFLNKTRLLPGVLNDVFGTLWPNNLALFLKTLSESQCMTDTVLLTKSECYYARNFLERVHAYFVNETLRIDLIQDQEETDRRKDLEDLMDDVPPVADIDTTNVREARTEEQNDLAPRQFGEINSYKHTGNEANPINERRALVIGVNRKTGVHKFYIISTPSDLKPESKLADDAKLIEIVKGLPNKYKDFVFIY